MTYSKRTFFGLKTLLLFQNTTNIYFHVLLQLFDQRQNRFMIQQQANAH